MRTLTFLLLSLFVVSLQSKNNNEHSITGELKNEKNEPFPFVAVFLKNAADSTLCKGELSNEEGKFLIEKIRKGSYYIEVKAMGYQRYVAGIKIADSSVVTDLGIINLLPITSNLQSVTVTAERPFIERQVDRTVVNIENSIVFAGSSIMDVMEKLPGVQVNQDGLISLKGKQGVIIYMDGKPTQLSGQDLANMLRGMSSTNIQKIEIITNPSAKYDAAGNAGIINIITKKNRKEGFNGSVNAGAGQGRYEKYNGGFSIGYKTKKVNLYAHYNYSHRKGFNNLIINRNFYSRDTLSTVFQTDNYIVFPFFTHAPRVGVDIYLSKKTTLSVTGNGVVNNFSPYTTSHTDIKDGSNNIVSSYNFLSHSQTQFSNYAGNAELKHQFDTTGKELVVNLDYARYWNTSDQHFGTSLFDKDGQYLNTAYLVGDQRGNLQIYSGKIDYTHPLQHQSKIETGAKSSYVNSDNDIRFYNSVNDVLTFDTNRSSHFIYTENINAGYVNYSREFKKLQIQAGLRAEHTNANGKQLLSGQVFTRNYVQLFPSVFFDYKFNDKHSLNLNVGRRIDRPAYQQMNPFRRLIDATTFQEGNPYLLPQLTYNSEITYGYKGSFFATLGYSYTYNNIADVLVQDAVKKITIQSVHNIAGFHYYNLNLVFSKKLTGWWTTNSSLLSYYSQYTGNINNYAFNQGWPSLTLNTSNNFFLGKGFSAELSFLYNYKTLYGVTFINPNSNLTIGIQKSILDKRGNIAINCSDLFWNAYPTGTTYFGGVIEYWKAKRETRVVNVNFTYRFGKGQTKIKRSSGADDEKQRAG